MGCVYKLLCNDGYYYIGSTMDALGIRVSHHKSEWKRGGGKGMRIYKHVVDWNNVTAVPIETCENLCGDELRKLEDKYILLDDPLCLNVRHATYDEKQYQKEYMKAYRQTEEYKQKRKEYRQTEKCREKGKEYNRRYREKQKAT